MSSICIPQTFFGDPEEETGGPNSKVEFHTDPEFNLDKPPQVGFMEIATLKSYGSGTHFIQRDKGRIINNQLVPFLR